MSKYIIYLVVFVLVGCNGGSDTAAPVPLEDGIYLFSTCFANGGTSDSVEIVISGSNFSRDGHSYVTADCSGTATPTTSTGGTYTILNQSGAVSLIRWSTASTDTDMLIKVMPWGLAVDESPGVEFDPNWDPDATGYQGYDRQ